MTRFATSDAGYTPEHLAVDPPTLSGRTHHEEPVERLRKEAR
jgi:hypothetical protein